MCILFFYLNSDTSKSKYRLILASNRDEALNRPTEECKFWPSKSFCIGGTDLLEGKEGGTWLAMNKYGRIAALLNIVQLQKDVSPTAKGRGSLVTNFVSSEINSETYFDKIDQEKDLYNKFHLITLNLENKSSVSEGFHYSNAMNFPQKLEDGIHAFGNNTPDSSWNKVTYGKLKFTEIIQNHLESLDKDGLINDLITLLSDSTQHWPDDSILAQANDRPIDNLKCLSGIFVNIYHLGYGTRVNSVILVDHDGNVDYIERALQSVPSQDKDLKWKTNKFSFTLETK